MELPNDLPTDGDFAVLLNLLNNAADAVEPLPGKWAEVKTVGTDAEISMMDSGKGMAKQFRDKVGQPFFTTKPVGRGTGLALSISKGSVKAHGGHLNLHAECEHTRFVVTLPEGAELQRWLGSSLEISPISHR